MPATVAQLAGIRSSLALEVLAYLRSLAKDAAELPQYYPGHLRDSGDTGFEQIQQLVQVVEDRKALTRFAAETERRRAAGFADEGRDYLHKARPESARVEDENEAERERRGRKKEPDFPSTVAWDEHAAARYARVIILGDPGFGKSTLLRCEARRLAHAAQARIEARVESLDDVVLPVLVRLPELAAGPPLKASIVDKVAASCSPAFRGYLERKLESGKCVLLLDAWDEVPKAKEKALRTALKEFLERSSTPALRLTSRIVGYGGNPVPGAQELELVAWETPQVESFVRAWFTTGEARDNFLEAVRRSPQVRGLVRVPLLLSLLCKAHQQDTLAAFERRVALFDRCVWGLLGGWKDEARGFVGREPEETESDLAILRPVALDLVEARSFTAVDLYRTIRGHLQGDGADKRATKLIKRLRKAGIIVRLGDHKEKPRKFLHRSIHESLAAAALAERANSSGWADIKSLVDEKANLPEWREVITLLAGSLRDPEPLLTLLLVTGRDDLFRSRLGLAMSCLAEVEDETRRRPSVKKAIDEITRQSWEFFWRNTDRGTEALLLAFNRGLPGLAAANGEIAPGRRLLAAAVERASEGPGRLAAIEMLGRMGSWAATREVLGGLNSCLSDKLSVVREAAAKALGNMGDTAATEPVVRALEVCLSDQIREVSQAAAKALGRMAGTPEVKAVAKRLADALESGTEATQKRAAKALGWMGAAAADGRAVALLLACLKANDDDVCAAAAEALGRLGKATTEVFDGLLACLKRPEGRVIASAFRALGRLAAAAPREVADVLIGCLEAGRATVPAAEALARMPSLIDERALSGIVRQLREASSWPNTTITRVLGKLGPKADTAEVLERLQAGLDADHWIESAEALLRITGADGTRSKVTKRLETCLGDRNRWEQWPDAAEVLGKASAEPSLVERAVQALAEYLRNGKGLTHVAAEALGRLGASTGDVVDKLVACLSDPNSQGFIKASVSGALGELAKAASAVEAVSTSAVIESLRSCLSSPGLVARHAAAEALSIMFESGVRVEDCADEHGSGDSRR